ncbi:membrane protein [Sulfuricella sp. T08]|uniref:hypothetical protein n=1 Tax=Sulfuricella sp. T08 TaxID=1632857 RepID=UPI00061795DD|nr:hypothetical protein [Sulfuricella sp. T08]GAO36451.1 membrane protein [Sulfuricella sp. T08]
MSTAAIAAKHFLRRAGWAGILGLAILLGSPIFYATTVLPMQEQLASLKVAQLQLRRDIVKNQRGEGKPAPTGEMQLKAFYGQLPSLNRSDECLAKIYAAAERQHIVLETGAYRLAGAETGNIQRFQITLPIKGSHVQIRHFLSEILTEVPALSLDDVNFKRETIDLTLVNAVIKMTLYLGGPA